MRLAILTDIHANREALDAVLDAVARAAPDKIVLLGDIVGYGPDPVHAVETAAALIADGAIAVLGNHDQAVVEGKRDMSADARDAVLWTREQLAPAHLAMLGALPMTVEDEDRLYVHASAETPRRWIYVRETGDAAAALSATSARLVFVGHTHVPMLFYARKGSAPVAFRPIDERPAPLLATRRHLVVVGSVGQPRDGNPAACFALVDTEVATVTMRRVPYDNAETARKVLAAGLPPRLADRLMTGR